MMDERRKQRTYEPGFALKIAREVDDCKNTRAVAKKHGIPIATAESWFCRYKAYGPVGVENNKRGGKIKPNSIASRIKALEERLSRIEQALLP